jgi:cell wall-associated NlpC family hydrolase
VGVHGQQVQRVDRHGLPVGYIVLAGASPAAVAAVTFAWGEWGKPDIFGANGPAACECSSLMLAARAAGGQDLSRTTSTQMRDGTATTESRITPGDLVPTPGSAGMLDYPGHVASSV